MEGIDFELYVKAFSLEKKKTGKVGNNKHIVVNKCFGANVYEI